MQSLGDIIYIKAWLLLCTLYYCFGLVTYHLWASDFSSHLMELIIPILYLVLRGIGEYQMNFDKCFFFSSMRWFLHFILLIRHIISIHLLMLNQPYHPGINCIWSWCSVLFICWWIWFASTLLRIFEYIVVRNVLQYSFLVMPLFFVSGQNWPHQWFGNLFLLFFFFFFLKSLWNMVNSSSNIW